MTVIHTTSIQYPSFYNIFRNENSITKEPPSAVTAAYALVGDRVTIALALTSAHDRFDRKKGSKLAVERLHAALNSGDTDSKFIRSFVVDVDAETLARRAAGATTTSRNSEVYKAVYEAALKVTLEDISEATITNRVRVLVNKEFGVE